jgi:dephospho-CoA kinase
MPVVEAVPATATRRPRIVVLTGGVGSGKSSVAEVWAALGVPIIDTDALAHSLTGAGGAAIGALREVLGDEYIDPRGALDRAKVRALVFSDAEARKRLEQVLHPLIRAEALRTIEALAPETPYAVLVIPLFFEGSAFREIAWRVAVVDCPVDVQIERVARRPGVTRETATAIVDAQVSREVRLRGADYILSNSGDLTALASQATALHDRLLRATSADSEATWR